MTQKQKVKKKNRNPTKDMGGFVFLEERPEMKVFLHRRFLQEWEIDYEEETLLDLITWTKT